MSQTTITKRVKFENAKMEFTNAFEEHHMIKISIDEDGVLIADTYYVDGSISKYSPNKMTFEQFKEYVNLLDEIAKTL